MFAQHVFIVVIALLGGLNTSFAVDKDRGGADGYQIRQLPAEEPHTIAENIRRLKGLKDQAALYMAWLNAKQDRIHPAYAYEFRHVLDLNDAFLKDIAATPEYDVKNVRGSCGWVENLSPTGKRTKHPRVASTLNGVPASAVCIDRLAIREQGLSDEQLVGMIVHEHCRHIEGCQDEDHSLARRVAESYREVVRAPTLATCSVMKKSFWTGQLDLEEVQFAVGDLLGYQPVSHGEVFRGQPFVAEVLGHTFKISAERPLNSNQVRLQINIDRNPFGISVSVRESQSRAFAATEFEFGYDNAEVREEDPDQDATLEKIVSGGGWVECKSSTGSRLESVIDVKVAARLKSYGLKQQFPFGDLP